MQDSTTHYYYEAHNLWTIVLVCRLQIFIREESILRLLNKRSHETELSISNSEWQVFFFSTYPFPYTFPTIFSVGIGSNWQIVKRRKRRQQQHWSPIPQKCMVVSKIEHGKRKKEEQQQKKKKVGKRKKLWQLLVLVQHQMKDHPKILSYQASVTFSLPNREELNRIPILLSPWLQFATPTI